MSIRKPIEYTKELISDLSGLKFDDKVEWYYNPIDYAWNSHRTYLEKYGLGSKSSFLLGMNPGPWGMAQTGIPFCDPYIARDWMHIPEVEIGSPENEREDRPVQGWASDRKEGSGQLLYGFIRTLFESLPNFFENNIVMNYCPLIMFDSESRNLTPEDLLKADRERIYAECDPFLEQLIEFYDPEVLIGIGRFAEERLEAVMNGSSLPVEYLPHPSPASPIATRDGGDYWRGLVEDLLKRTGVLGTS